MGSFVLGSTKGELQDSVKGPGNTEEKAVIKKKTNILSNGPSRQCTRASPCQKPLSWPADPFAPP